MNIEIDLTQVTADLVAMLTEIDRIEAIAAGKPSADVDEAGDQTADQETKS